MNWLDERTSKFTIGFYAISQRPSVSANWEPSIAISGLIGYDVFSGFVKRSNAEWRDMATATSAVWFKTPIDTDGSFCS